MTGAWLIITHLCRKKAMNQLIRYLLVVIFSTSLTPPRAGAGSNIEAVNSAEPVIIYKKNQQDFLQVNVNYTLMQAEYYILDANRSVVGGGKLSPYKNTILLDHFPAGAYTVKIKSGDLLASKQFTLY